jgi:hypothetical protein
MLRRSCRAALYGMLCRVGSCEEVVPLAVELRWRPDG